MDMLTAVERVDESLGLATRDVSAASAAPVADNDRAIEELQRMMGGLKG